MANNLIETVSSNPYESIVVDTEWQLNDVNEQIRKINSAIKTLEMASPTSPTLLKLRERLSELQTKSEQLNTTHATAKTLLNSYNDSLANANTMAWLYQMKQAELNRAQQQVDEEYEKMYNETKRAWENYINALWNATASENAIINANAWRQWASLQSTSEARARNYLSNAQAQAESYGNLIQNLNTITDSRLKANSWYVQLSQNNVDNTLRQQIMNDYEANQNAAKYWYWSWSWRSSWITLPNTVKKDWTSNSTNVWWNWSEGWEAWPTVVWTPATDYYWANLWEWTYWVMNSDVAHYQNGWNERWTLNNWRFSKNIANLDKTKVAKYVDNVNKQYWEDFNLDNADWYITDKWYLVLMNTWDENWRTVNRQRVIPLWEVSDNDYYIDRDWNKKYFR